MSDHIFDPKKEGEKSAEVGVKAFREVLDEADAKVPARPHVGVVQRMRVLLRGRDNFIVDKGLFREFVERADAIYAAIDIPSYQHRVWHWLLACFGREIAGDFEERSHRFFEEATELVQACGQSRSEAHALVDYVYDRAVGEKRQEVGGVMVTLAALCCSHNINMEDAAEGELSRVWTKIPAIREKQAAKPKHSPLPQAD